MRGGVLLDPKSGRPFSERRGGRVLHASIGPSVDDLVVPEHILRNLDKAEEVGWSGPMGSSVGWRDVLTPRRVLSADATAISGTSSETALLTDYTFAADALEVGDVFKYTLFGKHSTVITTPGTITMRLRWGGVGGTSLAASGAFAPDPTAASTDLSYCIEWYVVTRSVGATGSLLAFGKIVWNDFDDASATTVVGNLNMQLAPVSSPAAVTVSTVAAAALTPTFQSNVTTGSITNMIGILESLN